MHDSTYFSIRVYRNNHTCSSVVASTIRNKRKGTPQVVADVLRGVYPGEVDTPAPKALIKVVQNEAHVNVSYSTALRGKKLAISELVNPGTVTSVKLNARNKFKYLFVALGASIEGFRAMRKVIVVDATFLMSVYGGMLVFATGQDPNHHHYPIAMGVIDKEKDASWSWFFETLKTVIPDDEELVFMSDRPKSIVKAVQEVYPLSQHGFCVWHLSQNVRGKARVGCKDLCAEKFRECAHKYTEVEFVSAYAEFRRWFPKAAEYLDNSVHLEKWARSYFKGDKYNLDTSNACESMNSVFKKARKYALLPLIDAYIEKVSEWFNKHRKGSAIASDTKKLVPYLENQLHNLCAIANGLFVTELNHFELEDSVIGNDGKSYLIDTWALAYYRTIYLVPHQSTWIILEEIEKLVILPPDYTKKSGRKQDKRYPSTGEAHRKQSNKANPGIHLGRWFEPLNTDEDEEENQGDNQGGNPSEV
ncbi:uncharacterized protein LOC112088362 [Eutrema salsugineum]|uniref:uncharacterized protein LOC112088362 n=1 Tax=Eutrema salsugineum TaxID=72664 RepID=UPI000CED4189|nr:uncharacterized protein LOC112088362 [Eutrema salsugineum]